MSALTRLLIADRAPTRLGIRLTLEGRVDVCAEADTAEEAIRLAMQSQPDVCLIGWELAGGGGAAVRGVTRAAPSARVIVLADEPDPDAMLDAVRLGAIGFVPGGLSAETLERIVTAVLASEAILPRAMLYDLFMELRSTGTDTDGLTGREAQVLGLLRRGHSTATIARRLDIAPVTVRRHISELVRKLGVLDRSELLEEPSRFQRPARTRGSHPAAAAVGSYGSSLRTA